MPTFKIIKSKDFSFEGDKTKHVHFTVAMKGRVFGINTSNFEAGDLKFAAKNAKTIEILTPVEVVRRNGVNSVGQPTIYLDILPKLDISFAEI